MNFNSCIKILLTSFILLVVCDTIEAQRRSRNTSTTRQRQAEPEVSQTWYGISLGTLGFGNGFSISGKYSYGYRVQDRISVGAYGKAFYDLVNVINAPDISLFSYGVGAFTRIGITEDFFIQGEYGYGSYDRPNSVRLNKSYPAVGGGYRQGFGDWTYGLHIMIPLNEQVRDLYFGEYWIDFNYRF